MQEEIQVSQTIEVGHHVAEIRGALISASSQAYGILSKTLR